MSTNPSTAGVVEEEVEVATESDAADQQASISLNHIYLEHFGLEEPPFRLTPDTDYYYGDLSHQEVMNTLRVSLRDGAGFVKVTGEVGTGKTLLCRRLVNRLGKGFYFAYLPNPPLTPGELYRAIIRELEVEIDGTASSDEMLQLITDRLIEIAETQSCVVVLDEAQAIPNETMEALRLLTNLETEKIRLMQVVLFGQPELDQRLSKRSMRQLRQRIVFSDQLSPLDRESVEGYVAHRMNVAGFKGPPIFSDTALRLLHKGSRGIPRLINILAHKALLLAYGKGSYQVSWFHIRSAIADTEGASGWIGDLLRWLPLAGLLLAATWSAVDMGWIG